MNSKIAGVFLLILLCPLSFAEELHLTLLETLRRASQNSYEVLLAQAGSQTAAARTGLEKATFYPHFSVGSGAALTYGFPLSIEGSAPSIFEVNFSQALYDYRQRKQADSASLQEEGAQTDVKANQQKAALQAGRFYLELRNQSQRYQYHRTQLESLERTQGIIRTRVEIGVAEPRELTKAELEVARAVLTLTSNEKAIQLLEEQLKQAIGVSPEISLALENEDVPVSPAGYSENAFIETALESDPTLMQLRLQERSYKVAEEGLQGSFRPTVHLVGKYGLFSKFNNFDLYFNRFQRNNALFGVSIQLPLMAPELGPERRRLQAAQEEIRVKTKMRRDELRLEARRELADLVILEARESVKNLETRLARENLQAAQARYDQGKISLAELEEARREENSRWIEYLDVKLDKEMTRLNLYKRSGYLLNGTR
jgi:outer membrane protein TolC